MVEWFFLLPYVVLIYSPHFYRQFFLPKDLYLFFLFPLFLILFFVGIFLKKSVKITLLDLIFIFIFLFLNLQFYLHPRYLESLIFFYQLHFFFLLFLAYKFKIKGNYSRPFYQSFYYWLPLLIFLFWALSQELSFPGRMALQVSAGNPVYISGLLLFLLPLLWTLKINVYLELLGTFIFSLVIFLLQSRIALVILFLQLFIYLRKRFEGKNYKFLVAIFLILIAVSIYFFPRRDFSLDENRKIMYRIGFKMLKDASYRGFGTGAIKYKFHVYNKGGKYLNPYHIHCDLLELGIEYGWISYILFIFGSYFLYKAANLFERLSLGSLFVFSFFHFPFHLNLIYPLVWFLCIEIADRSYKVYFLDNRGYKRVILFFVGIFFLVNFYLSFQFYAKYALADYRLNEYLKKRNERNFLALEKSFLEIPYYYELAYYYGVACYRRGEWEKSYRVFDYIVRLRPEKTIFNNRRLALRKFMEEQLKKKPLLLQLPSVQKKRRDRN